VIPGGDNFCDSLVCEGEGSYNEMGFQHDGLSFGDIFCLDLGPYEMSIFGVGITLPHMLHLCFQQFEPGTVKIFGATFNLGAILVIISFSWALYIVFTT